ncbi:alpha/beta fold hydrolase [Streptomyces sp. DG1A-41]|uniref:alpha/beta fold hydrolase n=1 Tax=Streptomyces sp. DG1A-41 TaxID=3125779 RepID=UPI0030D61CFD
MVLALHGSGIRAGYFESHAEPGHSLLDVGAKLGFTVLALDRPGYGESASLLPEGAPTQEQAVLLRAALKDFARTRETGQGFFVVAHSSGGKTALAMAAQDLDDRIIGLDISGLGSTPAADATLPRHSVGRIDGYRHWGDPALYPAETFRRCRSLLASIPVQEIQELPLWPEMYACLAASVTVPVRFTFAEQEPWWQFGAQAVADLTAPLASVRVQVDHQPDAGHNISLGWAARTYHLRALAFLEECLLARRTAQTPGSAPGPDPAPAPAPGPDYGQPPDLAPAPDLTPIEPLPSDDSMSASASWQFLKRVMFPLASAPDTT